MKTSKPWVIGVVALGAGAAVIAVLSTQFFRGDAAPQYLTSPAVMGEVELAVLATGSLQPFEVVNVGAEASGQIISMQVRLGDAVKRGQLMAVIDGANLENRVRNTESQLQQQRTMLSMQQANLAMNQGNLDRETKLRDQGISSAVKYDQAANSVRVSQAQVAQVEAQIRQRELEIEEAKTNLDKTNIRAPIDAMVAEVVAKEGVVVNASQTTPTIIRLAKMDVMTVRTQISEADIIKIKPGQTVYFTILGDPGRRYYATLRTREVTPASGTLDPTAGGVRQQQAVYYNALFEVPNQEGTLLPAMTAEVHVVLDHVKNVLTVPATALGEKGADGLYPVRVARADKSLETRRIAVGLNNGFVAQVKSGLKVGEAVVIGEAQDPTAAQASQPLFGRAASGS